MYLFGNWCYLVVSVYIFNGIVAYHFDSDNVITYEDPAETPRSYFGFALALSNRISKSNSVPTIFIGAPRVPTKFGNIISESGTVFECVIDKRQCQEWKPVKEIISKPGAWLGGSLAVVDSPKFEAMVCAPRWTDLTYDKQTMRMKGMCYRIKLSLSQPLTDQRDHRLPLVSSDKMVPYGQLAEVGFSIDIIPDTKVTYLLGCPGIYNWRGGPAFSDERRRLSVPNVTMISGDDSLSGYAVTSGRYFLDGRYYATGAPRAANLRGSVMIFNYTRIVPNGLIDFTTSISGTQIGEYFGSALASCDIDGDGKDELLVGAPQWTKISDEGRIYIFTRCTNGNEEFEESQHINGITINARFGTVITCLEDIDHDGYKDVAVGAPYDGNGIVHIFHGTKKGLLTSTQNIFGPSGTRGFGISISKPVDIDNNGYADIAVGAYLSGHVILLRSKHVVSTSITLNSSLPENKLGRNDKSFKISVCCSSYTGKNAPQSLSLNVTRVLKIDDIHGRAYLNRTGEKQLIYTFNDTLGDKSMRCEDFDIYLTDDNDEFSDPFQVSVTQRLNTHNETGTLLVKGMKSTGTDYFSRSPALLNQSHQTDRLDILFAVECGVGTTCNSSLSIHINVIDLTTTNQYVIGSRPHIELKITVSNTGDPAYSTNAFVYMPSFIQPSSDGSTCENSNNGKMDNRTVVKCFIANRLNENATKDITLHLDMSSMPSDTTIILLEAKATTQSNDGVTGDHATRLQINCVAEADIGIAGETNKELQKFTLERKEGQLPSIHFNHTYEIKSYGRTPILEAVLNISIPTHWIHGGDKIELLKLNKTISDLGMREFSCVDGEINSILSSSDAFTITQWLKNLSASQTESKFEVINGKVFSTCTDNRTFFINCTAPAFEWKTINCKLGPFNSSQSTARLVLVFDLLLQNFTPEMMGDRNVIFFVTNASTSITKLLGITETINKKPDSILIGTRFIETPLSHRKRPSTWVLPLSVGVGLLLLSLIIIGLVKYGFFKRDKKAKLAALKKENENNFFLNSAMMMIHESSLYQEEENMSASVVFETTSSREALDAI